MGLFAVGGFVTIVSIVRLVIFIRSNGATDFSWINVDLGTWSIIEICVGVICTCVPALKPILDRVLPRLFSSTGGSKTRSRTERTSQMRTETKTGRDIEKGRTGKGIEVTHVTEVVSE